MAFDGASGPAFAAQSCSEARVDIRPPAQSGLQSRESFAVEIADTPESRAQGLMYREAMAPDAGMLFVYEKPTHPSFWMENTLIPLDMIFVDATGVVTRVHDSAQPLDRTPIDGGPGVQYVLEINGGVSKQLGIKPGDKVEHALFKFAGRAHVDLHTHVLATRQEALHRGGQGCPLQC